MVDEDEWDEDTSPDMQFTPEEREQIARDGLEGYFAVCRERASIISGLNSVMRGESANADIPEVSADEDTCDCIICTRRVLG